MPFESSTPLVSIIIPVFNGEAYLRECLDSILAQTYPRIEVIVMDDASTDSTPSIVSSYGERVTCHRQVENRGIYGNMNDGIARARGELIAFYHADDVYEPTIVEREVAAFQRFPQVGAVFCLDSFIDAAGLPLGRLSLPAMVRGGHPLEYKLILNALLTYKNRFLRCPSCMIPAAVYREVGVYRDTEFRNTSDLEMWLRVTRRYPLLILEEPLFRYRHHQHSSARRYHRLRTVPENYFRILDLYLAEGDRAFATVEALAAYEAHRAEDHLRIAVNHYILNQRAEAVNALRCVRLQALLGSPRIQRGRLLILLLAMQVLVRLPRVGMVSDLFFWHWYRRPHQRNRLRGEARL